MGGAQQPFTEYTTRKKAAERAAKLTWIVAGMALLALLIFGAVARVVHQDAGAVITLPNGGKYHFSTMTYGTNHVHGQLGARLVNDLPAFASHFLTNALGKHLGKLQSIHSGEPSLCIWFDPVGTGSAATNSQGFNFYARLANETGVLAGTSAQGHASPAQAFGVLFWAVPRRASVLELAFSPYSPNQPGSEICRVRLPNLLQGRFPQWRPDTAFPAVKVAGDVEVHLDSFLTGVPTRNASSHTNGYYAHEYRPAGPDEAAQSAFTVSFKPLGQASGSWAIHRAELSDATGNHLYVETQYLALFHYQNPFQGTLWPDESAWRLRLELKHHAPYFFSAARKFVPEDYGLRPEELLTFSNVPVLAAGATNTLWFTNTIGGTRIIMREYVWESPGIGSGFDPAGLPKFHAECADGSDDVAVDFVEATSPDGERLPTGEKLMMMFGSPSPRKGDYHYTALMHPDTNVPAVNITWLVQKTRPVEFLFKPPSL